MSNAETITRIENHAEAVAKTIIDQIGDATIRDTAARNFTFAACEGLRPFVRFDVATRRGGMLRKVKVTLDPSDTYTVEGMKINNRASSPNFGCVETTERIDGVYADMLSDIVFDVAMGTV